MNRTNLISLPEPKSRARVNLAEQVALESIAAYESVTVSEAIRLCIREAAKARALWPPKGVTNGKAA